VTAGARARRLLALGAGVALAARAAPARAHEPFQITADARAGRDALALRMLIADSTAARLCAPYFAQAAAPPRIDAASFPALQAALEACARELFTIAAAGHPLQPRAARAVLTPENDIEARVDYPPPARGPLRFEAPSLRRLLPDTTYGAALTVTCERRFLGHALLRAADPALEVALPDGGGAPDTTAPPVAPFRGYLRLGVEHILTGYDHLAFLLGLLVACRRWRSVLAVVTSFTVAHSVTLALAALRLLSLPGRVVEPLIAATIVFVAVENIVDGRRPGGGQPARRWLLAFAFGLVHGLGFAGALLAIGLGAHGAPLALPLFAFNLGVEAGQVAVAALLVPALAALRRWPPFARHGTSAVSLAVGAAGLHWLVRRLLGA